MMESSRLLESANAGTNLSFIWLIDFQYHTARVNGKREVDERGWKLVNVVRCGGEDEVINTLSLPIFSLLPSSPLALSYNLSPISHLPSARSTSRL
jgi:hypothetical protein